MPFKIKEARKEKGFTQEELAKRANVSRATIIGLAQQVLLDMP